MNLELKDKVAVVTGSTRGIGRAIAFALAAEGARVGICGRTSATLQTTEAELQAGGAQVVAVAADVGQRAGLHQFLDVVESRWGGWTYWSTTSVAAAARRCKTPPRSSGRRL